MQLRSPCAQSKVRSQVHYDLGLEADLEKAHRLGLYLVDKMYTRGGRLQWVVEGAGQGQRPGPTNVIKEANEGNPQGRS